jgi:DNA gyrase inhibitor GyrI
MQLTHEPKHVSWPKTHYVYIENIGPFQATAEKAWKKLRALVPGILAHNEITGYMSLYKFMPEKIYRAGVMLAAQPKELPKGLEYDRFNGGKYSRFVLTGPYAELPEATRLVFEMVSQKNIEMRNAFCIENYLNDPKTTAEKDLVTEILLPTV